MTIVYKLTDQDMRTHGGFQWELGKEYTASGEGELCSDGWLHCYNDPLVAMFLNPIHVNIENPRLFRAIAKGRGKHDHGLKSGYTSMTLIEELTVPEITTEQVVRFAILCACEVYREPGFVAWSDKWLSGEDRSEAAAWTAWAAEAATWTATWTAWAAAWAATWTATWAARAAWVAEAARAAARTATWTAWAAEKPLDLPVLAKKAMEGVP